MVSSIFESMLKRCHAFGSNDTVAKSTSHCRGHESSVGSVFSQGSLLGSTQLTRDRAPPWPKVVEKKSSSPTFVWIGYIGRQKVKEVVLSLRSVGVLDPGQAV